MTTASVLREGMSFGELALNRNQPRAATIVCNTDCHFAVMHIDDYKKCLLSVTKRKLQQVLDFLS
jgi:CRP-like cAMP-binding protein